MKVGNYLHLYANKWLNLKPQRFQPFYGDGYADRINLFHEVVFEKDLPANIREQMSWT